MQAMFNWSMNDIKQNEKCINKRSELMNSCRHQTKYLLKKWRETKHSSSNEILHFGEK